MTTKKRNSLPDMLTARQAAIRKGVSESAVRKAVAKGRLNGEKMGTVYMIRTADVDAWVVKRGPVAGELKHQ